MIKLQNLLLHFECSLVASPDRTFFHWASEFIFVRVCTFYHLGPWGSFQQLFHNLQTQNLKVL